MHCELAAADLVFRQVSHTRMTVVFENPHNGYRVTVDSVLAWLWTSIFGPFFFLFRGSTLHFFVWWLVAFTAVGPLLYPFFAASILRRMYYERGYRAVEQRPTSLATVAVVAAVFIVPILFFVFILSLGATSSHDSQSSAAAPQPSIARVAAPQRTPARVAAVPATPAAAEETTPIPADAATAVMSQPTSVAMSQRTPVATPEELYTTTGVVPGDTLNVRSGPGANYPVVERLSSGFGGLRIIGAPVMNDTTEWVQISFAAQSGWVARRYLTAEQPGQ